MIFKLKLAQGWEKEYPQHERLKIGIKSLEESSEETREILRNFDQGIFPEHSVERVYFNDFKTLLRYITPKRLLLFEKLH